MGVKRMFAGGVEKNDDCAIGGIFCLRVGNKGEIAGGGVFFCKYFCVAVGMHSCAIFEWSVYGFHI